MKIAVTGASGFVARHLIPLLLAEGHEVRGLARTAPQDTGAGGTVAGFTFSVGDVRHEEDVAALVEGCDAVVHMAASFDPEDNAADINERGSRTVVEAAREAGAAKLVFLSCLGAEAASPPAFYRSKWRAEQMVRASGIPYTILLPSLVLGNGDGVTRPLADLLRSLPVLPLPDTREARLQPIDVADLCRCIVAALPADSHIDEMISVGGPMFLTLDDLAGLIASEVGRDVPRLRIPEFLAGTAARFLPLQARGMFGGPRRAQLAQGVVASPGIVQRTFDFEPANVALGIAGYLA